MAIRPNALRHSKFLTTENNFRHFFLTFEAPCFFSKAHSEPRQTLETKNVPIFSAWYRMDRTSRSRLIVDKKTTRRRK